MITRVKLKDQAKKSLKGKWANAVTFAFIIGLFMSILSFFMDSSTDLYLVLVFSVAILVFAGPLLFALNMFFLNISRNKKAEISLVGTGFNDFAGNLALYLLMTLKIFLWSLLLVVPGIIASYRYSQAFFLKVDNPKMKANELLKKSSAIMLGHKMEFFVLQLSFIGWSILAVLTMGIGYLWLVPYMQTTFAVFYENLITKKPALDKK